MYEKEKTSEEPFIAPTSGGSDNRPLRKRAENLSDRCIKEMNRKNARKKFLMKRLTMMNI